MSLPQACAGLGVVTPRWTGIVAPSAFGRQNSEMEVRVRRHLIGQDYSVGLIEHRLTGSNF